jgi:O-antigen ligase
MIVLFLIASVIRTHEDVDRLLKVLVGGGAIVAFFALVEANTGYNIFNHLSTFVPILRKAYVPDDILGRGGRARTYASAQHAIELGADLVILVPLAGYLARRTMQRRWWFAAAIMLMGALATISRTSMLMLLIVVLVFLILRPRQTRRLWPALIPLLAVVHIAIPGTLGSLKESFFPQGGILKEQSANPGYKGSGRLADVGPALDKLSREPLFGQGFGTRITDGVGTNAPILDDQWLGTLVETGIVGMFAWLWLFVRALRRFGKAAKRDDTDRGWLLASVTASMAAYMIGMLTFDSFTFTQVTFILFIVLGLGQAMAALPQTAPERAEARVRAIPAPARV